MIFTHTNENLIVDGDMSADVTSKGIKTQNKLSIGVIAIVSGGTAPTGSLIIQASNDGDNWVDTTSTVSITNNGSYLISKTYFTFKFFRVFYDRTSGDGNLNVSYCVKGI